MYGLAELNPINFLFGKIAEALSSGDTIGTVCIILGIIVSALVVLFAVLLIVSLRQIKSSVDAVKGSLQDTRRVLSDTKTVLDQMNKNIYGMTMIQIGKDSSKIDGHDDAGK